MNRFAVALIFAVASVGAAFGQLYAGERFNATASTNVSLNGGNLILNFTTPFAGSAMPGLFAPSAPQVIAGTAYSIGPMGMPVTYTATVTFNPKSLPGGVAASSLRLYEVVNDEWAPVAGSTVNTSTNEVTGKLTSTATFAVLSGTPPTYENAIYYRSNPNQLGDELFARYLGLYGKAEPLWNLLGLTGGAPQGFLLSPSRNGIITLRLNPAYASSATPALDAYTANIDGSNVKFLAGPFLASNNGSGAAFTGDGMTLYANVQAPGSTAYELLKITIATGAVSNLGVGASSSGPSIGGGVLAYASGQTITTIVLSSNKTTKITSPGADGAVNGGVDVSYDGTKLVWVTNDGAVYTSSTAGTGITKLIAGTTNNQQNIGGPHFSPDGTKFEINSDNGLLIVTVSNPSNPTSLFGNQYTPGVIIWR